MSSKLQQSCRLLNHLMRRPGDEFELFSKWVKAEHFTHLTANYCLKTYTVKEQQEDNSTDESAIWSIFADLNSPLSPKLPDKDALHSKTLHISARNRATKVMPCWAGLEAGRVSDQSIISHQLVFPFFVSLFPYTISFFNAYSKAYLLPGNFWHHPSLLFGLVLSANHQCQTATFIVIFRTNPNYSMWIKNANYIIFADFFTQTMILITLFKLDLSSINIWIK